MTPDPPAAPVVRDAPAPPVLAGAPPAATFPAAAITALGGELELIAFNADGLVPAVVQEVDTREVLMLAWMDAEALRRTLQTGRSWFYSRSRRQYWQKGETSGDRQWVRAVRYDCDGDTLLVEVRQEGRGACHTGARSCFFRSFGEAAPTAGDGSEPDPDP